MISREEIARLEAAIGTAAFAVARAMNDGPLGGGTADSRKAFVERLVELLLAKIFALDSSRPLTGEPRAKTVDALDALAGAAKGVLGDELARDPLDYVLYHYRHPALPESRAAAFLVGPGGGQRTTALLDVDRELSISDLANINGRFIEEYFDLIGRSDSFTDSIIRASVRSGEASRLNYVMLRFEQSEAGLALASDSDETLRITVSDGLRAALLCTGEYHLDRVFIDAIHDVDRPSRPGTIKDLHASLVDSLFFQSREGLLESVAIAAIHDGDLRKSCLRLYDILFPSVSTQDSGAKLRAVRRIVAIIQGSAFFSRVAGDVFHFFLHRFGEGEAIARRPPAVLVLGGGDDLVTAKKSACEAVLRGVSQGLAVQFDREIEVTEPSEQTAPEGTIEETALEWVTEVVTKHETLTYDAVLSALELARNLVGRKHEGRRIDFRLAVGSDHVLRQNFEVRCRLDANGSKKSNFELDSGESSDRFRNRAAQLAALLEGNYSFLQDADAFVCTAVGVRGLRLAYLASPSVRLGTVRFLSLDRMDLQDLSGRMPDVLLLGLRGDGVGYAAMNGSAELRIEGGSASWKKDNFRSEVTDLTEKLVSHIPGQWKSGVQGNRFIGALAETIVRISADYRLGATFILGNARDLKRHVVEMTDVFELVPEWRLVHPELGRELFRLAIQDGATMVAMDEGRVFGRQHISCKMIDVYKDRPKRSGSTWLEEWNDDASDYYWPRWGKWYKWGTRHRSAAALAYGLRGKAVVICVSQDGPIHLFDGIHVSEWEGASNSRGGGS